MFDWPFFRWNAVVIGCPVVSTWWHQWAGIPGRSSTTRLPSAPQLTPLRRWFSAYSRGFLLVQLSSFVRIVSPWFINFTEIEGLATGSDVFFKIILSFIKFGDMDPSVLLRRTFSSIASFISSSKAGCASYLSSGYISTRQSASVPQIFLLRLKVQALTSCLRWA